MEKRDTPCCEEAIIHADTLMQVKSLLYDNGRLAETGLIDLDVDNR